MKKSLLHIILLSLLHLATALSGLAQQSAAELQAAAEAAYDRGYTVEKPADQAVAFDEAAGLFDQAAKSHRAEGQEEKARGAEHMAGLARQNAEHRRKMAGNALFSQIGPLSGKGYKLYSPTKPKGRFYLLPEAGIPVQSRKGIEVFDGGGIDQLKHSIYSRPELVEQLFESLGGEVFPGTFSGPGTIDGFQRESSLYKGLAGGIQLTPRWQLESSVGFHQSRITARFPMTGFRGENYEPYTFNGQISTELRHTEAALGANYTFLSGAVRPYAGLGMHYSGSKPGATQASIAEVSFTLQEQEACHSFGPYLACGISWQAAGPLLLRISGKGYAAEGPDKEKHRLNGMLVLGVGLAL